MKLMRMAGCFALLGPTLAHGEPAPPFSVRTSANAIASDESHALAIKRDGTVLAWGANDHGQLGDGTENDSATGVVVANLNRVVAVAANYSFSMARRDDGTVWTWGNNEWGQLGDGTYDSRSTPAPVAGLGGIVAIAAGNMHALALKSDGTVWTWGSNDNYRLGDGTAIDRVTPQRVPGLSEIVAIAAGQLNNAAVARDGSIWRWGLIPGLDRGGKIGSAGGARKGRANQGRPVAASRANEGTMAHGAPSRIFELAGATSVAVGLHQMLILRNDGTVWIAGENDVGQLGDGTTRANWTALVQVPALVDVVTIAARSENLLALQADGTVWEWGASAGLSVIGGEFESATPQRVPRLTDVMAIATGGENNFAVRRDGTLAGWGADWPDRDERSSITSNRGVFERLVPCMVEPIALGEVHDASLGPAKTSPSPSEVAATPSRAGSRLP